MDKSGVKIITCCFFSTSIILILFILAIRFTQPTCELMIIEPKVLRESALNEWTKMKPLSSHDKSLVFRMSAYLEYNHYVDNNHHNPQIKSPDHLAPEASQIPAPPVPQNLAAPTKQVPTTNHPASQINLPKGIIQIQIEKATNVTTIAPQNHQMQANGALLNQSITSPAPPTLLQPDIVNAPPSLHSRRFLPLQVNDIELLKNYPETNRSKYIVNFNCTNMNIIFVRKPTRVYVESIKIELKVPTNKHKIKCEVKIPNNMAFATDVNPSGMAHYKCPMMQTFNCVDKNQEALLSLHIVKIQWETGNTMANSTHKIGDFMSEYKTCINLRNLVPMPAVLNNQANVNLLPIVPSNGINSTSLPTTNHVQP